MSPQAQAAIQTQPKTAEASSIRGNILQRAAVIPAITPVHNGILQRCSGGVECAECRANREKREKTMQRAAVNSTPVNAVPPVVHEVLGSSGQPLDAGTRAFMEPRFGYDFSQVQVHTGERAAESARAVNALAYTVGKDVVFGARQYEPGTSQGRRLLAHELTHVVQQSSLPITLSTKLALGITGDAYEQEADRLATSVSSHGLPFSHSYHGVVPITKVYHQHHLLQRQVQNCYLKPIEDECGGASAKCMTVDAYCKSKFPKPSDLDNAITTGKGMIDSLGFGPNAKNNFRHWLDNTGTELVMPTAIFESHKATNEALLRHREKFIEGVKRRLGSGELLPGNLSEQIVFTGHADAFTLDTSDDLAYAVGGYQLCSKVRVKATSTGKDKFNVVFVEWSVQAFDCYNWDPGKGIQIPGFEDKNMCCVENAGKARHYQIRTDPWDNKFADSMKDFEVSTTTTEPSTPPPSTGKEGDRRE